jgi:hypothetical protein
MTRERKRAYCDSVIRKCTLLLLLTLFCYYPSPSSPAAVVPVVFAVVVPLHAVLIVLTVPLVPSITIGPKPLNPFYVFACSVFSS